MRENNKKSKKPIFIIIALVLCVCIIAAGGYAGNMFGYFNKGNSSAYSTENAERQPTSLDGKAIVFLGSSVTYGFASKGESFADFLEAQYGIISVKEAKSGTTLVDDKSDSYISRLKKIDKSIQPDAFVCQLSTNDATQKKPLGKVSEGYSSDSFDTHTVAGAIEYIISYAKETWDCPVVFFTNPKYDSAEYESMVKLLGEIREKWDITVIDLWNNEEINSISDADRKLYMNDDIHPTRLGYRDLWTPIFKSRLEELFAQS